jgi:hypothetical protein
LFAYPFHDRRASYFLEVREMGTVNGTEAASGYWEHRRQQACPLCQGTGFRMIEKHGQTRAQKCRCISLDRVSVLQKQSGIAAIYWNQSLDDLSPRTLEELSLIDSLRDILNDRELTAVYRWIVPSESVDTERTLSVFANDLIRFYGYSCLWLECQHSRSQWKECRSDNPENWTESARKVDFLFIQNLGSGFPRSRQQKVVEEILWDRARHGRSFLMVGEAPCSLSEAYSFFEDRRLATWVMKETKIINPTRHEEVSRSSRWLF